MSSQAGYRGRDHVIDAVRQSFIGALVTRPVSTIGLPCLIQHTPVQPRWLLSPRGRSPLTSAAGHLASGHGAGPLCCDGSHREHVSPNLRCGDPSELIRDGHVNISGCCAGVSASVRYFPKSPSPTFAESGARSTHDFQVPRGPTGERRLSKLPTALNTYRCNGDKGLLLGGRSSFDPSCQRLLLEVRMGESLGWAHRSWWRLAAPEYVPSRHDVNTG